VLFYIQSEFGLFSVWYTSQVLSQWQTYISALFLVTFANFALIKVIHRHKNFVNAALYRVIIKQYFA